MTNIQWYSPLDSDTTEIARYSQAILPALHKKFSLGLVTDAEDNDADNGSTASGKGSEASVNDDAENGIGMTENPARESLGVF